MISGISQYLDQEVDKNRLNICQNMQSRFFIQYQCAENANTIYTKGTDTLIVAVIQVVSALIIIAFLVVNLFNTRKMGKAYDELNLTASDYNIMVDIQSRHRHEFDVMFRHEL